MAVFIEISVDPALNGYDEDERERLYRDLFTGIEALPGVEAATMASPIPLDMYSFALVLSLRDQTAREDEETMTVQYSAVGPRYFETMAIPLLNGRAFTEFDNADSQNVAIINEATKRLFWPDEDAVGKRFHYITEEIGES